MDPQFEAYLAETLNANTRRCIAATLGDLESHLGHRDERIRRIILDGMNRSMRAIYRQITGTEVESAHP